MNIQLKQSDTLYYYLGEALNSNKLATFDLDSTLIQPKSGKFAKDASDWEWAFPNVPEVLLKLKQDGYNLVLFSNQKGIKQAKTTPEILETKLNQMNLSIGKQIWTAVFLAGDDDYYRKPRTGMWEYFLEQFPKLLPDRQASFYCGDAAGRPKGWKKGAPKDFSRSDLYFAQNIDLPFKLPEEVFSGPHRKHHGLQFILSEHPCPKGKGDPYVEHAKLFDWSQYFMNNQTIEKTIGNYQKSREIVMLIGLPAAGKSTLSQRYAQAGYQVINMDTLKTKAKCLKACQTAVEQGHSIVIDNTNPTIAGRKEYLDMAKKAGNYRCKAIRLRTPDLLCQHLNHYRVQISQGKTAKIPMVAYRMCASKMTEPTDEEGFDEIVEFPFCLEWDKLSDREKRELNYHYDL